MEAIICLPQINTFYCEQDEWYAKEGTGKSMKNALYVQRYGKRAEATSNNNKKIKPEALAIVELCESEGIVS